METRSRKRAEASSTAPPPQSSSVSASTSETVTRSHKRARTTAPFASSSSVSRVPLRSSHQKVSMDSTNPATASSSATSTPVESSSSTRTRRSRSHNNNGGEPSPSDKGKEKEPDVRVREVSRDNNRERDNLGLNIEAVNNIFSGNSNPNNSNNEDDDNDSEGGGIGAFHQNFTSASSALQGLLRKLGAGLDDLLPSPALASVSMSHQSGKLKKILSGLRADGEEGKQVENLTQLCEILSIGTEESLSTFSVDSFVPVLVGLLNHESNPDIMLLAARAITHLCDVLPSSCAAVVHYGAIPCFVARLLTIEYMDLAEQSLQALKKISQEHPSACLRAGALMAVLSYLDFFSTGVQRVALSTAANMCKKLPSDAADFVMDSVPLLTNLLQYHDAKVLEHASVCLTRIVDAFASSSEKLDELCKHGLVTQSAALISSTSAGGGQTSLSSSTYTGLIRLLSTCASGSNLGAKTLLQLGISAILKEILSGSGISSNSSLSPALSRPAEQVFEIVNLANELLPPLPYGTISLPAAFNVFVRGSVVKKSPNTSGKQDDVNENSSDLTSREKLLHDQPELLQQCGVDLLPVLIQIYGSSVSSPVRHKCLSVIAKLMFFSNAGMIQSVIGATNISSFLAGVLAWKDPLVLIPSLQIAEILMEKLPGTFSKVFIREGVVHAIDQLVLVGKSNSSQASNEKDSEIASGTSSRSRRYKRRSGGSNAESNFSEGSKGSPATNSPLPSTSIDIPYANSNLCTQVSEYAKAFKEKYFPLTSDSNEVGATDDLLRLKNLCAKLISGADDQKTKGKGKSKAYAIKNFENSNCREEYLIEVVSEILTELRKGDGVSTFEFIGSGVVSAFMDYLSCGLFLKEKISEANIPKHRQLALKRFKLFVELIYPNENDGTTASMTILVQKLQNALSSVERFPVVLSHSSRPSSGTRLSTGLSALVQPVKLRLCRAQGEKSLKDYSSNVVLIDPLASLAAVEDFLWPRVQKGETGQKSSGNSDCGATPGDTVASSLSASTHVPTTRRQSSRRGAVSIGDAPKKEPVSERNASSSKGKGKAVLKPAVDEGKGPQTRNAARRLSGRDKDTAQKPIGGDFSSDDEELGMSPVEFDDTLVIEDDDLSDDDDEDHDDVLRDHHLPICPPEKVHDVKLGDAHDDGGVVPNASDSLLSPASGSSSIAASVKTGEHRGGSSYSSRGAMSFAAAAMAGLGSGHNRGFRGARDRHGRPIFGNSSESSKLIFTAGGKKLNRNLTIYQVVQRQLVLDEDENDRFVGNDFVTSDGSRLGSDVHSILYQRAESQTDKVTTSGSNSSASKSGKSAASNNVTSENSVQRMSLLDSILVGELPCYLDKSNSTYNILALLRVLEGLNQLAPRLKTQSISDYFAEGKISSLNELNASVNRIPVEEFVNGKLTPKLARQIQDALALCSGSVPSWCYQLTKACPFLFPFETRRQYFYSTSFGLSRALHRLHQQQRADGHGLQNEREVRVGRIDRQKVRVSRNHILDSAVKVMEMYSGQKAVLEVEYFGEIGTGLGPTLEFYTLLSHDLQKTSLGMWRSDSSSGNESVQANENMKTKGVPNGITELVYSPLGLFPRPWPQNTDQTEGTQFHKVIEYFRLMGRVMAKALEDGRLLDLPLSTAFYKLVLSQELDMYDILSFDAEFGKILLELHALVCRKRYLESVGIDNSEVNTDLCLQGAPVEDLSLYFSLPGYPEYSFKSGDELVNIDTLEEYLNMVVDATVKSGIARQIEAFRSGFKQVFDITSLQIFTPLELDCLLCGRRELWEADTLADHIKFDHGYTAKSPAIVNLLEIMGEFTPEQQRAFCQFVTGAPRLPPGGLAVLNPKLTIVRKHSSTLVSTGGNSNGPSESADEDLPSVMTCANYLKLPPYSTKEIMYKKLLYAINEGQGSFDLS